MSESAWSASEAENGVITVKCDSWLGFIQLMSTTRFDFRHGVFRGQARSEWSLTSTLDRALDHLDIPGDFAQVEQQKRALMDSHLENFMYATRGRRGEKSIANLKEEEWWALGQHYGLATPLLDWSESPFVAAYFAFCEDHHSDEGYASVYALSRDLITEKVNELKHHHNIGDAFDELDGIRFVRPLVDDNSRLVNQRGWFTWSPANRCLRDWIGNYFRDNHRVPLIEILIPRSERKEVLFTLERMNVNALTLFPDLGGASEYCNDLLRSRFS